MLLSLSGYLFEDNYCSQSISFKKFCSIARSSGYDGVELRKTQVSLDTLITKRKDLLKITYDAGLTITCLTARNMPLSGIKRNDYFYRYIELCKDMECSLLKISGDPAWLNWAAEQSYRSGVTLATNNHIGGVLETINGIHQYFTDIAHSNFGLIYDSLHLYISNHNYIKYIKEFFPFTKNILIHSMRPAQIHEEPVIEKNGKGWLPAAPGEPGTQNWSLILKTFKDLGYSGLITVFENGWPKDRHEYVAKNYSKVIHNIWAKQ